MQEDERPPRLAKVRENLGADIDPGRTHFILIILFFVTGLVDSAAYNIFTCFVSMQTGTPLLIDYISDITGNTVFVGLGVSSQPASAPPFAWTKSLLAIVCFMLGSLFFSTYHRKLGPTRKITIASSFLAQTLITLAVAILVTTKIVSHSIVRHAMSIEPDDTRIVTLYRKINWKDLAPISLLAFQSGGQIVASRVLRHNDLPTAVVTSMLCDLMSDVHLLNGGVFEDSSRNRRFIAACMLLLGAITGGALSSSWVGLAGILYIAAGLKALIVIAWLLWPRVTQLVE